MKTMCFCALMKILIKGYLKIIWTMVTKCLHVRFVVQSYGYQKVEKVVFNSMFSFIYRISGQNYHCMGSLKPPDGNEAKFCQLYIHDTENEITNKHALFRYE
ncbi:hypothetical protein Hdeb2414_s0003g00106251 [Helianthus debilis subsp. tardiflorus]